MGSFHTYLKHVEFPRFLLMLSPQESADNQKDDYLEVVEPLKGNKTRDWVSQHVVHCLPITIGNQYGFAIKSTADFTAVWNGGPTPNDTMHHQHHWLQSTASFNQGLSNDKATIHCEIRRNEFMGFSPTILYYTIVWGYI